MWVSVCGSAVTFFGLVFGVIRRDSSADAPVTVSQCPLHVIRSGFLQGYPRSRLLGHITANLRQYREGVPKRTQEPRLCGVCETGRTPVWQKLSLKYINKVGLTLGVQGQTCAPIYNDYCLGISFIAHQHYRPIIHAHVEWLLENYLK